MQAHAEATTRQYAARIVEISEELVMYPNFQDTNKFDDDKIMDINENTNPVKWQHELIRQGFDNPTTS